MPHPTAKLCTCGHPKSIHYRIFANSKLGTPCRYPACKCKTYKAAKRAK